MGLARELLREGSIAFRDGPEDGREMRRALVATIGVASPAQVATFEQRVAAKQDEFAREVISEGQRQINGWGSYYGDNFIDKQIAGRLLRETMTRLLNERR